MKIDIEYKITMDVEAEPPVPPTIVFDGLISSGSGDPETALTMIDVGERDMTKEAKDKLTIAVSDYLKSLEE